MSGRYGDKRAGWGRKTLTQAFTDEERSTWKIKPTRLAINTWEWTAADGTHRIRFHRTDIITHLDPSPSRYRFMLRSGGYETHTTAERMDRYLPHHYRRMSSKGEWFIYNLNFEAVAPFEDGMILPDAFRIETIAAYCGLERKAALSNRDCPLRVRRMFGTWLSLRG